MLDTPQEMLAHWNEQASQLLKGRTIVLTRNLEPEEMADLDWHSPPVILCQLDDGSVFFPSRDDEGNAPGVMNIAYYGHTAYHKESNPNLIPEVFTPTDGPEAGLRFLTNRVIETAEYKAPIGVEESSVAVTLTLDNGNTITFASDMELSGPGALFGQCAPPSEDSWVLPVIPAAWFTNPTPTKS